MKYLSVKEIAALWNTSERSVRNYCAAGRVPGARVQSKKVKRQPKQVAFWRRRRDLNSRAGFPTYALSRGASSPT